MLKDPRSVEVQEKILQQRIRGGGQDQAAGGGLDAQQYPQDAADYPVQDIRGIDLGASGGSDGSEGYSG